MDAHRVLEILYQKSLQYDWVTGIVDNYSWLLLGTGASTAVIIMLSWCTERHDANLETVPEDLQIRTLQHDVLHLSSEINKLKVNYNKIVEFLKSDD